MKKFFFVFFLLIVFYQSGTAQFYKSVLPSPEFTSGLEKIVQDFRFNFKNLKDTLLWDDGGTQTYQSSIKLPGAEECRVTYYNSKIDTTASWQAVMYKGSNFNEAMKAYQNTFRLVKKSHMKWLDHSPMRFVGEMEIPKEEIGFATSTLLLDFDDKRYKRFFAEVDLLNSGYDNWEVQLNLLTKKLDDERY